MNNIYYNYVKLPHEYFKKWEKLPEYPGTIDTGVWSPSTGWKEHDFPRTWCLLDFIEWTQGVKGNTLGYTAKDDPELEHILNKFNKQVYLPYPEYDLHNLPNFEEKFDFFLFNQTLEHLYDPRLGVANISKNMNIGGLVFTSVPTINIPHMTPVHFGGLTPMGLAVIFLMHGFEIVKMGQWGNHNYINKIFKDHIWPDYYDLMDENGVVTNEERNCCQCWILARRIK